MEFFKKIYTKYFSVNLKDYSNIGINFEINKFLLLIALGLCVACIFINYYQGNISLLLKKLSRLEAFSEEKSKTLKELGLQNHNPTKRLILRDSGVIKKVVCIVGRKRLTYEEYIAAEKQKNKTKKRLVSKSDDENCSENQNQPKTDEIIDFSKARIYIIPEMRDYAEHSLKNGASPVRAALYCVMIFAFFAILIVSMPSILSLINSLMA